jgi:hypothetical protein
MGGEETHIQLPAEAAIRNHTHSASDGGHGHGVSDPTHVHLSTVKSVSGNFQGLAGGAAVPRWEWEGQVPTDYRYTGVSINTGYASISVGNPSSQQNGGAANVMQPWICLGSKIIRVQ